MDRKILEVIAINENTRRTKISTTILENKGNVKRIILETSRKI